MDTQESSIFRQKSLDHLASPERLDQLMQVTSPKGWLALSCVGSLVMAGVVWGVFSRLPITVTARGAIVRPGKVVMLQTPNAGQLITLSVQAGDYVRKGQVVGSIAQPELEKQLQQQRIKLVELQGQARMANSLQQQRATAEQGALVQQRQNLMQRIQEAQTLTPVLKAKGLESVRQQRQGLQQRLQAVKALVPVLQERLQRRQTLLTQGVLSADAVLEAEQSYQETIQIMADTETQLKALDVREVEAEKSYRDNLTAIADLQAQLQQLNTQQARLAQESLETTVNRTNEIQEVKRNIDQITLQLTKTTNIVSTQSGKVLEVTVAPGQVISSGTSLATLELNASQQPFVALAYLPVRDGKRIQPGMQLQLTPDTVPRERYGGIVGQVQQVSPFPITAQGMANRLGNPALLQGVGEEPMLEVIAELEPDRTTSSGYRWSSSQGPDSQLSSGTTVSLRITVEERSPVSFVIPLLRSLTGTL